MRECEKCHISVATNRKTCPLCGNILVGKSEQGKAIYPPFASAEKQRNIALRILLFSFFKVFFNEFGCSNILDFIAFNDYV